MTPLDLSEEPLLDLGLGKRRTDHPYERPVATPALAVDIPGHHVLSDARLPLNQHGGLEPGDSRRQLDHLAHRRAACDDLVARGVLPAAIFCSESKNVGLAVQYRSSARFHVPVSSMRAFSARVNQAGVGGRPP